MTQQPESLQRSEDALAVHTVSITINGTSEPVAENLRVTDQGTSWIELAWDELADPDVSAEHYGVAVFTSPPTPSSFYAQFEAVCGTHLVTGLVADTTYYIMILSAAADGTRLDVLTLTVSI